MIDAQRIIPLAALMGAVGLWLLLPRGRGRGRFAGAALGLAGLGVWAAQFPALGDWIANSLFAVLATVTVVSAIATVTFRSPVYCAIWFGMTLVGTSALFLLIGAEFLAMATLIVYAGAILVTFLFVLMLAQPEGDEPYDRMSWEAMLSAATGAVLVGILSMTLAGVMLVPANNSAIAVPNEESMAEGVLAPDHVARLGSELFTRHLVAVEVAGTLLFAALVGAAVIVAQGRPQHRASLTREGSTIH